jgi:lysophospholipase L1-like esterase
MKSCRFFHVTLRCWLAAAVAAGVLGANGLTHTPLAGQEAGPKGASKSKPGSKLEQPKPDRWEPAIRRFEELDKKQPPPKDGILFLGSSSIVGWDVKKSFPDLTVLNRGFGGSQVADSVRYADRIVLPYRPRVIVFYAGDNDIAAGKTPQQVLADFQSLVRKVRAALPTTRIVYVAIKPSLARWRLIEKMRQANRLIQAEAQTDPQLAFVDVDRPMIGPDGKPRPELFKKDGLHLNDQGYRLWSELVRPHLKTTVTDK